MLKSLKLIFVLIVIALVACQRGAEDIAGKSESLASIAYAKVESVTALPAAVTIEELLPHEKKIDGAALFVQNCAACHQVTGLGVPGAFPPLDGSGYVNSDKVERLASIMLYGLRGPIVVNGNSFNSVMTPFRAMLSDEQLAAIASHVRSSWSNKSGPVDPKVFAEMRAKWGERAQFEISELGEEPGA